MGRRNSGRRRTPRRLILGKSESQAWTEEQEIRLLNLWFQMPHDKTEDDEDAYACLAYYFKRDDHDLKEKVSTLLALKLKQDKEKNKPGNEEEQQVSSNLIALEGHPAPAGKRNVYVQTTLIPSHNYICVEGTDCLTSNTNNIAPPSSFTEPSINTDNPVIVLCDDNKDLKVEETELKVDVVSSEVKDIAGGNNLKLDMELVNIVCEYADIQQIESTKVENLDDLEKIKETCVKSGIPAEVDMDGVATSSSAATPEFMPQPSPEAAPHFEQSDDEGMEYQHEDLEEAEDDFERDIMEDVESVVSEDLESNDFCTFGHYPELYVPCLDCGSQSLVNIRTGELFLIHSRNSEDAEVPENVGEEVAFIPESPEQAQQVPEIGDEIPVNVEDIGNELLIDAHNDEGVVMLAVPGEVAFQDVNQNMEIEADYGSLLNRELDNTPLEFRTLAINEIERLINFIRTGVRDRVDLSSLHQLLDELAKVESNPDYLNRLDSAALYALNENTFELILMAQVLTRDIRVSSNGICKLLCMLYQRRSNILMAIDSRRYSNPN